MAHTSLVLGVLLALAGCSGGSSGGDAATGDAAGDASASSSPDIVWLDDGSPPVELPTLTPCPTGWREVSSETGAITCDPYPEGGALSCAPGEAHFPGDAGCVSVGSPCPAGEFSEVLPADGTVLYVQPGATGDGTRATPYGSLADFPFGGLPVGTVVALSRGTHPGPVGLVRGMVLVGACAAATVLTTDQPSEDEGVVTVRNARGEVRDLTVASSPRGGVWLRGSGAEAVVDGVVVTDTELIALTSFFEGARLTVRETVVRETRGRSRDGAGGQGVNVQGGATVEVSRALFERNRATGLEALQLGTQVTLSDVVVRETQSQTSNGADGRGLGVRDGATAQLDRALFEGNHSLGVYASSEDATMTLSDVIVRDTRGQARDGNGGRGLNVQGGARAELSRTVSERNREIGVFLDGAGTQVMLSDVVVRDTQSQTSNSSLGRGLEVQGDATAELSRAAIERNRDTGIFVGDEHTALTMSDVFVRDTEGRESDGTYGRGLAVEAGAEVEMGRVVLERNRDLGLFALGAGTAVTLSDVVVRDTDSRSSDGTYGRGLSIESGATATVSRALLERNKGMGAFALSAGTALTLSDVVVRDTRPRGCADTTCADSPGGHGVGS